MEMNLKPLLKFPKALKLILRHQFKQLDNDNDGFITSDDIRKRYGFGQDQMGVIMNMFDKKKKGKITFSAFKKNFIKLVKILY